MITAWKYISFLTPDMASKNDARHGIDCSLVRQPDAMSGIVFWRHVWRQKAHVFSCCNHLPDFGIWGFKSWFQKKIKLQAEETEHHLEGYKPKFVKWLQVWCLKAFWRHAWRKTTMPYMTSIVHWWDHPMPYLASFFDAISDVKKVPNFTLVISCTLEVVC